MERQANNSLQNSVIINKVESGLPRWLIEVGFVLMVVQAVCNEQHLCDWIEGNGYEIPRTLLFLVGDVILYYAMLRGMKTLRYPFTWMWWTLIVVDVAGCITYVAPESPVNLALAIALPLVYLPLGLGITYFYRGRLQWVGVFLIADMVVFMIFPIVLFPFELYLLVDVCCILTVTALAWTMRRVLV